MMASMLRKSSSKVGSRGGDEPSTPEEEQVKVRILAPLICVYGPSFTIGGSCNCFIWDDRRLFGARQRNPSTIYQSLSVTGERRAHP